MNRRELLLASGACAALAAARSWAQPAKGPRRIGFLYPATREFSKPQLEAFTARLAELGYVEGRDIVIEKRWADGNTERMQALARELVALNPALIVTATTPAAAALKKATSTVPVVFIEVSAPDELGFVQSLARPGGNMTGTAFRGAGFNTKLAEVLRETLPAARRIAVIDLETYPTRERNLAFFQKMFSALGFELAAVVPVNGPEDFGRAYVQIKALKAEVVWAVPHALLVAHGRELSELALQARLPLVGPRRAFAAAGGLLSYDNDLREAYRRAAGFVDKILKGAKPADLPVEQPDRFQLVINLRTAKALGIRIPQSVLLRAAEVIE